MPPASIFEGKQIRAEKPVAAAVHASQHSDPRVEHQRRLAAASRSCCQCPISSGVRPAQKRSQARAKAALASGSDGAEPCPQAGIATGALMAQSQGASCPRPSVFLRIRPIERPSCMTQKSLGARWPPMTVARRTSFEPDTGAFNGGPTSLQDTGSGARGAGACEIDHAIPANAATAKPSLSKVSQRGAASLVSTIDSVTTPYTNQRQARRYNPEREGVNTTNSDKFAAFNQSFAIAGTTASIARLFSKTMVAVARSGRRALYGAGRLSSTARPWGAFGPALNQVDALACSLPATSRGLMTCSAGNAASASLRLRARRAVQIRRARPLVGRRRAAYFTPASRLFFMYSSLSASLTWKICVSAA